MAVLEIDARRVGLSRHQLAAMGALVSARLTASGAFRVAPRGRVKRALADQRRRSYGPSFDRSSRVRLGRDRAAVKSVSTRIMRTGRRCLVTVTLFDLETATAERAGTSAGACTARAVTASIVALAAWGSGPPAPIADLPLRPAHADGAHFLHCGAGIG